MTDLWTTTLDRDNDPLVRHADAFSAAINGEGGRYVYVMVVEDTQREEPTRLMSNAVDREWAMRLMRHVLGWEGAGRA